MTTDPNEDPGQAVDQQQQPGSSEWNGQEPMRRRRRPGRKRKRRPQQQQQQRTDGEPTPLPGSELSSSWRGQVDDDPDALQERDGIMLSINKSEPSPASKPVDGRTRSEIPQRNQNKNEFVQGIVLRVQDKINGEEEAQQSRQVEDIRMPTERRPAEDNRSYRRPYSVAKKEEEEQTDKHGTPGAVALKNLLKQNGGLSLSEILQQQNLSLDDLLKGKQTALKALQNTSVPIEPAVEAQKGPRRIPGPGRPVNAVALEANNAPKPLRRNNFNQQATTKSEDTKPIRRIPNYQKKPTVELITAPSPTDITAEEVSMVGTIASFLVPPKPSEPINTVEPTINAYADVVTISTRAENSPGLRRLPIAPGERIKPIKEVVSGIRPDLHNSSTRKRLQPVKVGGNLTNTIAVTTTIRPKSGIDLRERLPPRWGNGYRLKSTPISITNEINEKQEIASEVVLNVDGAVVAPAELTTSTTTTTTAATTTVRTPDIIKDIVKSRLLLRPRIKGVYTTSSTTTTSTTTTSTEQPSTELPTQSSANFEYSENYETTIIPYMEDVDFLFSNSSQDNIGEIISKSEPEINVIEQLPAFEEFAIKAGAEVESINQLFQNAFKEDESFTLRNDGFDNVNAVENIIQRSQIKESSEHVASVPADRDVTEQNPSLFVDITSTRPVDDRTDILELLEDRRSGARLYKVLAQRNMTLNELLDHRQRGSSQLHLAEIFHNKSKTDVPAPASADHLDIVTAFDNFPTFNLGNVKSVKPDDIKTDSEGSSYFTSIINIKPTDEVYKEGRALREEKVKVPAIAATKQAQTERSSDFWNFDADENNVIDDGDGATQKPIVSSSRLSPLADEVGDSMDAVYKGVEQIENEVARAHDIIDLELSGHGYKRNSVIVESAHNMPVGVRSAIIASSSIVGISFLVFIIIFVTCRWRQRRKKTFNYSENFQAVRSRLPILTRDSGSSSKRSTSPPDVFPGGSRSSKINTMDPNSPEVQEYLYDAMRKPFQ